MINVLYGMMLGVMLAGQMEDGLVLHPYRTPCFLLVALAIIINNTRRYIDRTSISSN